MILKTINSYYSLGYTHTLSMQLTTTDIKVFQKILISVTNNLLLVLKIFLEIIVNVIV